MENNIRKLRKSRDLTMKQFGEMMGVSESAISLYENNKAQPDINMMYKMADYFDVSIDFLLGRKTDESKEKKTEITFSSLNSRRMWYLNITLPFQMTNSS